MGDYILDDVEFSELEMLEKFLEGHNGFIAGGCFKDLLSEEKKSPKDIDIWFRNEKDFQEAEKYFEKHYEDDDVWSAFYSNDNVRAFWNMKDDIVVELVKKAFGTPREILDQFDFTLTKFAFYKDEEGYSTYYSTDFFDALEEKRMTIDDKCLYPVKTFERMLKYSRYGYRADKDTKILIISKINQLDLDASNIYEELSDFTEDEWY